MDGHGGELLVSTLAGYGVGEIFTLSGGHIFSIYDGAVKAKWRIVDERHEQTATFAAEGMAKLTRRPGVAVLTAGPGITNGVSAITTAHFNGSPLVVVGGRAPQARWGSGSLQELAHAPLGASITKAGGRPRADRGLNHEVSGHRDQYRRHPEGHPRSRHHRHDAAPRARVRRRADGCVLRVRRGPSAGLDSAPRRRT